MKYDPNPESAHGLEEEIVNQQKDLKAMAVAGDLGQVGIMDWGEGQHSYCRDLRSQQELEVERQQVQSNLEKLRWR